jgi:hypothetical protein
MQAVNNTPLSGRTFKAWISTSEAGVSDRIASGGPWFLPGDGGLVAANSTQLLPGIRRPINVDENGDSVAGEAWTGTLSNGTLGYNCNDWTTGDSTAVGLAGSTQADDIGWIAFVNDSCSSRLHLYCFEQRP